MAATARPDGYTLAQFVWPVFCIPFMRKTTYDPARDVTCIVAVAADAVGVVVKNGMQDPSFIATRAKFDQEPFYLSSADLP